MRRFAGACRFVCNKALAWQNAQYAQDNTFKFSYTKLANLLPEWKRDKTSLWLKDSPSQTLQQALKNLESSFRNFFAKRTDFPKFKKRGQHDSFRYPQGFKVEQGNSRLFLPKLGWIRYRNSRTMYGEIKNITVNLSGGKWVASLQTEREVEQAIPVSQTAIGIDLGIARFATLSDGTYYAPLNSFKKHQQRLAKYQRCMARKTKFSNNWKKAKAKVSKIHARIGNCRRDYLHKTTTTISQNHAMVSIEDLQIRNMSKSAAGTTENASKNVRTKSGLNRSILDQGWFEFRRQLDYKMAWQGGFLVAVPPHNTSRTCPCCGHVSKDNRLTQTAFVCMNCAYENNADVVGAINILERGHRLLACGESVQSGYSVKQEPTEVTTQITA